MISLSFHQVSRLTIESHDPGNGNALTLRVEHGGKCATVTLFDLPTETTDSLIEALGPIVSYSEWSQRTYGIPERQGAPAVTG